MSRAVGSIEKSAWAARFKACAPFQFKEALEVAERLNWGSSQKTEKIVR